MLAVLDDLLFALRRQGFSISTAQAVDAMRAVREVGLDDKNALRAAIGCVVVDSADVREKYFEAFDAFFALRAAPGKGLGDRLLHRGITIDEIAALREALGSFLSPRIDRKVLALLAGGSSLDHLFASDRVTGLLRQMNGPLQRGFYTHRVLEEMGMEEARSSLERIEGPLGDAIGAERADLLLRLLMAELDRTEERIRSQVDGHLDLPASADEGPSSKPFADLSDDEIEVVRKGVRLLAERLRGAARVKARHRKRGRLDASRTMRRSLATGGVPFRPVRRDQRRDRPRLVLLCDVSESVRRAARFMLEFTYILGELFDRTQSFVFVSELGEVTSLFEREPIATAVARAAESVVNVHESSSYLRAFRTFEAHYMAKIDRRTTVVILGDGRTNYGPSGAEIVARIRARAKSVLWLCPEPRSSWGLGDSAMPAYARSVTEVIEASSARHLERAARRLVHQ